MYNVRIPGFGLHTCWEDQFGVNSSTVLTSRQGSRKRSKSPLTLPLTWKRTKTLSKRKDFNKVHRVLRVGEPVSSLTEARSPSALLYPVLGKGSLLK